MISVPKVRFSETSGLGWSELGATDHSAGLVKSALFRCPFGHVNSLHTHEITESGIVMPSVVCPSHGCGFNDFVQLEFWEP